MKKYICPDCKKEFVEGSVPDQCPECGREKTWFNVVDDSEPQSNFLVNKPVGTAIIIGIIIGWILSFILICLIIGGSIDEMLSMEGFAFRVILFISFPMGAILGTTFVLAYRKVAKDKQANKQTNIQAATPTNQKDTVTKLKELKDLLDAGVLTQEEFNAQKEKLLAEH